MFVNAVFCLIIGGVLWNFKNNAFYAENGTKFISSSFQIQTANEPFLLALLYFTMLVLLERIERKSFLIAAKLLFLLGIAVLSIFFSIKLPSYLQQ